MRHDSCVVLSVEIRKKIIISLFNELKYSYILNISCIIYWGYSWRGSNNVMMNLEKRLFLYHGILPEAIRV